MNTSLRVPTQHLAMDCGGRRAQEADAIRSASGTSEKRRLIIGISGASGSIYGIRLLEMLSAIDEIETHLVISNAGRLNIAVETDYELSAVTALADHVYNERDIGASIASGSFRTAGMVVAPCSMRTLSAIVHSMSDNLLVRAADVVLKERRRLVLMPRESPLHLGHCRLLTAAAELGAFIAPPMPAFYNRPISLQDIVDHTVGRVLDLFDIDTVAVRRWEGVAAATRQRRDGETPSSLAGSEKRTAHQ